MAVVENGKLSWSRGYGVSDRSTDEPVTARTVFRACSLSKVVTAYASIRMWKEEGRDLDAPLAEILPHPTIDDPTVKPITLQMILSHTSGLSHSARDPVLEFKPGERFSYSSGGFAYLQKVIEHLREVIGGPDRKGNDHAQFHSRREDHAEHHDAAG